MVERKTSGDGKDERKPELSAAGPIDAALGSIEALYRRLTGAAPPEPGERPYAPIPVERDPEQYVGERIDELNRQLVDASPATGVAPWSPTTSVWEDESELVLCLDLPGVAAGAVEVAVDGTLLTVRGHRGARRDGGRLRLAEGPYGPFVRRFALPRRATAEPEAKLRDGILELHIAKRAAEPETARRVAVA